MADIVWEAFGDVDAYVEPFFGSGAVLLGRPTEPKTETVNDLDMMICNFWRAVQADPEAVAHYADYPVSEVDLSARHIHLVKYALPNLAERMPADPDYFDVKVAGWWVWGLCCWIGSGWCSGNGPWTEEDGKLVKIGDKGVGVNRQLVHLGNPGQGVNRQLVHLGTINDTVPRGKESLIAYMQILAHRLRWVRVCCGDWRRVVTKGALAYGKTLGIFLDPPYSENLRRSNLYTHEAGTIPMDVQLWCIENGEQNNYRIALCGYGDEHAVLEACGWRVHTWKSNVAYQTAKGSANKENRKLERIWFSPACLEAK